MKVVNGRLRRLVAGGLALAAIGAAVAIGAGTTADAATAPQIVGGHPATERYPWIAELDGFEGDGTPYERCTASLVGSHFALIAAHCVTNDDGSAMSPADFRVLIGNGRVRTSTTVTGVTPFPTWNWGVPDPEGRIGDLAVVDLGQHPGQQRHVLDLDVKELPAGARVLELGWGETSPTSTDVPGVLQELDTKTDPPSACSLSGALPVAVGEVCVANRGTAGPCDGDSGGPLVHSVEGRWEDQGIDSRGQGPVCGLSPDVVTDTAYYRPWIYAVMRGVDPVTAVSFLPGGGKTGHGGASEIAGRVQPGPTPLPVGSAAQRWAAAWSLTG